MDKSAMFLCILFLFVFLSIDLHCMDSSNYKKPFKEEVEILKSLKIDKKAKKREIFLSVFREKKDFSVKLKVANILGGHFESGEDIDSFFSFKTTFVILSYSWSLANSFKLDYLA